MCGIVGGWWPGGEEVRGRLAGARVQALAHLRHRGPDDEGHLEDGDLFLAMRRLAVIDLPGGAQPLGNEDGSVSVVANGEIYNYRELTRELEARGHRFRSHSDMEVLVHLWEELGEDLCEPLVGMFSFALWDRRSRQLVLARDRFGKKPLYLHQGPGAPGGVLFASEPAALLPLLEAVGRTPSVDPRGIWDYLSLACVPEPRTVWQGVGTLPPATVRLYRPEEDGRLRCREHRYWQSVPGGHGGGEATPSFDRAAEEVRATVADAVRLRLRSDVPLGLFLSGGLDSAVVAREAAEVLAGELRTFTVSVPDPDLDEAPAATALARHLGVRHRVLPLDLAPRDDVERLAEVFQQPFADPSALPSLAVARLAREHVTVVLNGDGGDEIFAGYRRYLAARWAGGDLGSALSTLLAPLADLHHRRSGNRRSPLGFLARLQRSVGLPPGERWLAWTTDMLTDDDKATLWQGESPPATATWVAERLRERAPESISPLHRQMAGDRGINLLSDLLVKMDRATMATSLEARSPLLDHRLAELVDPLPENYKVRRFSLKALLRHAYRDRLPTTILKGGKRGFEVPLERWLAEDLADLVRHSLESSDARLRQWLEPRALGALARAEHPLWQGRHRAYVLYSLVVLELWLQRWA